MPSTALNDLIICWYAPWFSSLRSNYLRILELNGYKCKLITSTSHFDSSVDLYRSASTFDLRKPFVKRLKSLSNIYREVHRSRANVLVCDIPNRLPQCVLVLLLTLRFRTLIAIDDVYPHDEAHKVRNMVATFQKWIVSASAGVITFSSNSAGMAKQKYPRARVFTVPLIPEVSEFSHFSPIEASSRSNFVMIGRWSKYKGFEKGIELFKSYIESNDSESNLEIWCSGLDSPLIEDPRIVWRAHKSFTWHQLCLALPHYKGVLLPYLSASQSGVQSLAWDAGVPCLVSDLPGLAEFQPGVVPPIPIEATAKWIDAISELDQGEILDEISLEGQIQAKGLRSGEVVAAAFTKAFSYATRCDHDV